MRVIAFFRPAAVPLAAAALVLSMPSPGHAQDAARFFDDNCAMCHTIGGTAQGAPDLKDVTKQFNREWLVRFMVDPEGMSKHDRAAKDLIEKWEHVVMPRIDGVTPEIAEQLLRYIDEKSGAAAPASAAQADTQPTPGDIALGHEIYTGARRLSAGGPACLACHRLGAIGALGGGTLGPDLTGASRRLGGARGLNAWLSNPPTRVMRAVFRRAPIATDEARALTALISDEAAAPVVPQRHLQFLAIGSGGAALTMVVFGLVWARRFRGARRPTIARARQRALETRDE